MTALDPQRVAADPGVSAFVTANAGSGKTKTLIDRVARLLLAGAKPEAILCVTYTKAAAAEMQRRLFETLGRWSVLDDAALAEELARLDGVGTADLSKARRLFAQALETPGGLKIQTIHAFCEKLLRRFPLEAGVSPGFTVMDDAAAAGVAQAARRRTAEATQSSTPLAEAYARFSVALDYAAFQAMFAAFETRRGALRTYVERCGGLAEAFADVRSVCGVRAGDTADGLAQEAVGFLDPAVWRSAATTLFEGGGANDAKAAAKLIAFCEAPDFSTACAALFTQGGEGDPATWPARTGGLKKREDLRERLLADQTMLRQAKARIAAARVAEDTIFALTLAYAYGQAYEQEKAARGALDFADLIEATQQLLTRRTDAAWVLFKLDGGVDHILLDEAQDTAPEQWAILRALTGEFFAGDGASERTTERTLFIVGDEKQSIYSFQGADPARLLVETQSYLELIEGVGRVGTSVPLTVSYRSTAEVLRFVDALFEPPQMRDGVPAPRGEDVVRHEAFRDRFGHQGCVDLWPLEQEVKGEEREAWDAPLDAETATSANRRLAERIATEIKALVERGDAVFDKEAKAWRPAHYGDVLVLVRRRRALFEDVLRALKQRGVPVAGADRLALSSHIAFDDLMALGRFVLFPDDDLTLAALLKSPFCGLDDDALYPLARGRKGTLWAALSEGAEHAEAVAFLRWALEDGHRLRPFEFYVRALDFTGPAGVSMRARMLTRLGAEAQDALEEFLAQTLAAEQRGAYDLESLIAAFAALDITVKREMEGARREVRVMTAHGAKGLEAPIVFLPETTVKNQARGSPLLETEAGGFLWSASSKADCAASAAARERRKKKDEEEALRLFYVALTRARDRLVLCGRLAANAKRETVGGWYGAAEAAFAHEAVAGGVRDIAEGGFVFRRFGPDPVRLPPAMEAVAPSALPPAWTRTLVAPERDFSRFAAPSRLGDEADEGPAPSPLAMVQGLGLYRRGALIHRLLQLLPDLAPAERPAGAARLLAGERDLTDAQRQEMTAAAFGVLDDPRFAEVFGPGSKAEVALAGTAQRLPAGLAVSGRIDRLAVLDDRVLVVDFKTNRPAPDRVEDADAAYVAQMAVYAAVLAEVFPGRRIEAALVWTDGPKLTPIPEKLMAAALAKLAMGG